MLAFPIHVHAIFMMPGLPWLLMALIIKGYWNADGSIFTYSKCCECTVSYAQYTTYHEVNLNGVVAKIPKKTIDLTIGCDVIILQTVLVTMFRQHILTTH